MGRTRCLGLWAGLLLAIAPSRIATAGEPDRDFRERVAPILERRCLRCHGSETARGGLSLASRESALRGGENGPAIVPGQPAESLLVEMISGDSPEMPQKEKPLTVAQVEGLRRWVEQGAHWPAGLVLKDRRFEGQSWWSFRPLARPMVPQVRDRGWVRTPIDAFILARLEAENLHPSPEADRRTLIRRLTLDLHGLPPTPDQIARFLNDPTPDAHERLVDRLLASPRYGERWGRHWLDIAHYGDTHGYDKDKRRDHAWPYRDYVIRALNEDIPYARFVREQIAGDVIEPGEPRGVIAAGFVAAGPWDFVGHAELAEGTIEKAKTRLLDRDDMVSSTMSTFVSLTVHCARCHDHKFDPIPQRDYYRLQAVFAGVERGDRLYETRETDRRRAELAEARRAAVDRLREIDHRIAEAAGPERARLDAEMASARRELAALPPGKAGAPSDGNGYHSSIHPTPEATAWVQLDLSRPVTIDEIRLIPARPVDFPDTPGFGFPRRFRVEVSDDPTFPPGRTSIVAEEERPDDEPGEDRPYVVRVGGRPARYVRVTATRLWKRLDDYVFALAELEVVSGGRNRARGVPVAALDSIELGRWGRSRLVDGFDSRHVRPALDDPSELRRLALLAAIQERGRLRRQLTERSIDRSLKTAREAARTEIARIDREEKAIGPGERVYSVLPRSPRTIAVLHRGEVEQPGEVVGPGSLACVPGLDSAFAATEDEGARRAALADWIVNPANMLTWRSIANRVWQYHFGRGLVETPNDFGRNGATPTHPELLDWLAVELRDGGTLKALHRRIVTSSAYRQSSSDNAEFARRDADNRLLWRMNRRRLDAEELRDGVLLVSGDLDPRMGGPGYEPFFFKDDHSPIYDHTAPGVLDHPGTHRRAVYRFIVRSVPDPFLECLDGADPNQNTPVRSTTITALQALAMLNDTFVIRESRVLARRLEAEIRDPADRIASAFERAMGRPSRPDEFRVLSGYVQAHGLANACRLLFNANEFLFVD